MGVLKAILDIILILSALASLIAFAVLGYSGLLIYRLVKNVKGEVTLASDTAKETLHEVQGASRFVGSSIVRPAARAAGYATAIRATVRALTEDVVKRPGR